MPSDLENEHLDARSLVVRRLARQSMRFPDLAIESSSRQDTSLDARDRGFAKVLETSVLVRWRTIEHLLRSCSKRNWLKIEPALRGALLSGAAQILFMEGVPDHAAVDETVRWSKSNVRKEAGGFVNGILRSIIRLRQEELPLDHQDARTWWLHRDIIPLENGTALRLSGPILPEDPTTRLGIQASLGEELILGWIGAAGWDITLKRAQHCLMRPPITIANGDGTFETWNEGTEGLGTYLESAAGRRVQDRTASMAVEATRALSPHCIVDFCAGRGTKTGQLAEVHPDARILAGDTNDLRRSDLAKAFKDHERVEVVEPRRYGSVLGKVDLLVLDVPCSNSGVLPRRPQARYRHDRTRLQSLRTLQKQIVEEALPLLAPGAHVLYSTCSLEPAENEEQVDWLRRRFDARVLLSRTVEPTGQPGQDDQPYADGGFHALLTRDHVRAEAES